MKQDNTEYTCQLDSKIIEALGKVSAEACTTAGSIVSGKFRGIYQVSQKAEKEGEDLVTDVDKESQKVIYDIVQSHFPNHTLLGEEDPPEDEPSIDDFVWAVDPIDGTKNFVNGSPVYAVSIGVLYKGVPVAGAIWLPWPGEKEGLVIHARLGGGTWMNGERLTIDSPKKNDGSPHPGRLSSLPNKFRERYRTATPLRRSIGEVRIMGSTAYEMCLVAINSLQYALSGPAHTWDFAAGVIIVKEAGGTVLTSDDMGRFREFEGWQSYINEANAYSNLRNWLRPMLAGSKEVVGFVGHSLQMQRPSILRRTAARLRIPMA